MARVNITPRGFFFFFTVTSSFMSSFDTSYISALFLLGYGVSNMYLPTYQLLMSLSIVSFTYTMLKQLRYWPMFRSVNALESEEDFSTLTWQNIDAIK